MLQELSAWKEGQDERDGEGSIGGGLKGKRGSVDGTSVDMDG